MDVLDEKGEFTPKAPALPSGARPVVWFTSDDESVSKKAVVGVRDTRLAERIEQAAMEQGIETDKWRGSIKAIPKEQWVRADTYDGKKWVQLFIEEDQER